MTAMGNVALAKKCFLCGSSDTVSIAYLASNSASFIRNAAYLLPQSVANILSRLSDRFSAAYYPVRVNKRYFDRTAVLCLSCMTGSCQAFFEKGILAKYYEEFYWSNRDIADGQHVALESRPNERQLGSARQRIAWIESFVQTCDSVIDFGAGDCAAAYSFAVERKATLVHAVDPSLRARAVAAQYGVGYSEDVADAPMVDLIYSAHSIEHVSDFLGSLHELTAKIRIGGHIFFETPNIGDLNLFKHLPHTPHTFMLSQRTFRYVESQFPLKIVGMEVVGPRWRASRPNIGSDERADLRVLLRKIDPA